MCVHNIDININIKYFTKLTITIVQFVHNFDDPQYLFTKFHFYET